MQNDGIAEPDINEGNTMISPLTGRACTRKSHLLAACLAVALGSLLALSPTQLSAQTPPGVGTAGGWGLGAMTEARFGEAVWWNPALLSIFDGPSKSISVLNTSVQGTEPEPLSDMYYLFRDPISDRPFGPDYSTTFDEWTDNQTGPGQFGAKASVQWLGLHTQDLGVSVVSHIYWKQQAPLRAVQILDGNRDALSRPLTDQEIENAQNFPSQYSSLTIASIAKGSNLMDFGEFGRGWIGGSVKAGIIHSHREGIFRYGDAIELATDEEGEVRLGNVQPGWVGTEYSELGVEDVKVFAGDFGAVLHPSPTLLVSATLLNPIQVTTLDKNTLDIRVMKGVGLSNTGRSHGFFTQRDLDLNALDRARAARADEVINNAHLMRGARGGFSLDTRVGRITGGLTVPFEDNGIDHDFHDQYSIGFMPFISLSPRVSYSHGVDGSHILRAGIQQGFCDTRLGLSGGYIQGGERGDVIQLSASLSFGQGQCGPTRRR